MTYLVLDDGVVRDATPEEIAEIEQRSVFALPPLIEAAIAATYLDVDGVYRDAVGQRGPEYLDAEADARAFVAAGYAGEVSPYVSEFALHNPTGEAQTDQWSADSIIARADAFKGAKMAMRNTRFVRQAEMRTATTTAALQAAVGSWNGFIAGLRAQLGL